MEADSPEARLSRELAPGERLLWSGRPPRGLLFRRGDLFLLPFSLFWCGFVVLWTVMAARSKAPDLFWVFGLPFLLVGFHLLFGRFAVDILQRRRTSYGVTTSRVLVVSGLLVESVESMPLRGLAQVSLTVRSDGSGDIAFGPRSPFAEFLVPGWPGAGRLLAATFERIPAVREVHDLIVRAQAEAA